MTVRFPMGNRRFTQRGGLEHYRVTSRAKP